MPEDTIAGRERYATALSLALVIKYSHAGYVTSAWKEENVTLRWSCARSDSWAGCNRHCKFRVSPHLGESRTSCLIRRRATENSSVSTSPIAVYL